MATEKTGEQKKPGSGLIIRPREGEQGEKSPDREAAEALVNKYLTDPNPVTRFLAKTKVERLLVDVANEKHKPTDLQVNLRRVTEGISWLLSLNIPGTPLFVDDLLKFYQAAKGKELITGKLLDPTKRKIFVLSGLIPYTPAFITEPLISSARERVEDHFVPEVTLDTIRTIAPYFDQERALAKSNDMANADEASMAEVIKFNERQQLLDYLKSEARVNNLLVSDLVRIQALNIAQFGFQHAPEMAETPLNLTKAAFTLAAFLATASTCYISYEMAATFPAEAAKILPTLQQGDLFRDGISYFTNAFGPAVGHIGKTALVAVDIAIAAGLSYKLLTSRPNWARIPISNFVLPRIGERIENVSNSMAVVENVGLVTFNAANFVHKKVENFRRRRNGR